MPKDNHQRFLATNSDLCFGGSGRERVEAAHRAAADGHRTKRRVRHAAERSRLRAVEVIEYNERLKGVD